MNSVQLTYLVIFMQKKNRRKVVRDKADKKQRIFQAFADLVNEKGYENVTMRDIAEKADIGLGTIYIYFSEGKPAIAGGFMEYISEKIFDMDLFLKLGKVPPGEMLEKYVRNHLTTHRQNFEIHRAFEIAELTNQNLYEDFNEATNEMFKKIVAKIKNQPPFNAFPEELVLKNFTIIFNFLEAVIHRHLFRAPFFETDEELVLFLKDLLIFLVSKIYPI